MKPIQPLELFEPTFAKATAGRPMEPIQPAFGYAQAAASTTYATYVTYGTYEPCLRLRSDSSELYLTSSTSSTF